MGLRMGSAWSPGMGLIEGGVGRRGGRCWRGSGGCPGRSRGIRRTRSR